MEKEYYKRLELRKFGFSFSLGMLILLILGFLKQFNLIFIIIIAILFVINLLFAIWKPELLKFFYLFISSILKLVGLIITNIFLAIFFYFIFTPIVIFLRILGKDEIKKNSIIPKWIEVAPEENDPKRIEKLY